MFNVPPVHLQEAKRLRTDPSVNISGDQIRIDLSAYPSSVSDTVGAICVDSDWNVASAASSGGIMLKHPGRVGPASCYGAGVWAEAGTSDENDACRTACCASGSGEYLMKTLISERVCGVLKTSFQPFCAPGSEEVGIDVDLASDLGKRIDQCYRGSPVLRNIPNREKLLGVLGVRLFPDQSRLALTSFHSTKHFCVAYSSLDGEDRCNPVSYVSALPDGKEEGSCFVVNCAIADLKQRNKDCRGSPATAE
jgi:taspase (threonine aspartase 1)